MRRPRDSLTPRLATSAARNSRMQKRIAVCRPKAACSKPIDNSPMTPASFREMPQKPKNSAACVSGEKSPTSVRVADWQEPRLSPATLPTTRKTYCASTSLPVSRERAQAILDETEAECAGGRGELHDDEHQGAHVFVPADDLRAIDEGVSDDDVDA